MKKIYVVHAFQGKKSNMQAITVICRNLTKLGVMPISPVHSFSYLHDNIPEEREKAMEMCEELVEVCDAMFLCGEWWRSEGCQRERDVALQLFKPIYEVVGWHNDLPIFAGENVPAWLKGWLPLHE